ncbi:MAG: DUF4070 domain-containing protein, partial [bacterium]|nr:DUF4070 domain-containing protein [bacterium]
AAHLATPRIGTQFWNRISREGRLMDERSDRRNMRYDLVHQPTRMTRDEALAEFMLFQALVYEGREIFSRTERNITEIGPRYAAGLWAVDATYWASTKGYIHHHPDIAARVLPSIRKDWLKYIPRT